MTWIPDLSIIQIPTAVLYLSTERSVLPKSGSNLPWCERKTLLAWDRSRNCFQRNLLPPEFLSGARNEVRLDLQTRWGLVCRSRLVGPRRLSSGRCWWRNPWTCNRVQKCYSGALKTGHANNRAIWIMDILILVTASQMALLWPFVRFQSPFIYIVW